MESGEWKKYIEIDKDPWINRGQAMIPRLTGDDLKGSKVNSLIDDNNNWTEEKVRAHFNREDANYILNTPLGDPSPKDEIIWSLDKKGIFKVKSAYHLALFCSSVSETSVSDPSKLKSVWQRLWKIKSIPKAKICTWKFLNDILPNIPNLQKKNIDSNPLCVLCRKNKESTSHTFWGCKVAIEIWNQFIPSSCREDWTSLDFWS